MCLVYLEGDYIHHLLCKSWRNV